MNRPKHSFCSDIYLAKDALAYSAFTASETAATWSHGPATGSTSSDTNPCNGIIRWYDPVTGRWLSKDPIGISGGLNQYVFCANNPVNFRDPEGKLAGYIVSGVLVAGTIVAYIADPWIEMSAIQPSHVV